jgi:hypothetical protein
LKDYEILGVSLQAERMSARKEDCVSGAGLNIMIAHVRHILLEAPDFCSNIAGSLRLMNCGCDSSWLISKPAQVSKVNAYLFKYAEYIITLKILENCEIKTQGNIVIGLQGISAIKNLISR